MSKSGEGDVSMRTTSGVALQGGKPRRNFFRSLHLTRWTDHFESKTYSIPALYRRITSPAVLLKSKRLRGIMWMVSWPYSQRFLTVQPRKQSSISSHIQDIQRLSCLSRTGMSTEPVLDASCQLHDRTLLGSQRQSRKRDKVNSAEYHRMLTRGRAATCIGFRASEGQLKVRRLIASAVVDSCLDYIAESYIFWECDGRSSNSFRCDISLTLTQEIVTCPSCRLERFAVCAKCYFYWGWSFLARLVFCESLIKLLKKFWAQNNRSVYANVIHDMHETSRPIRTHDIIGCHGNRVNKVHLELKAS